jgi:hypothetical protein
MVFSQKDHKLEYEAQKSFVIEQSIEMVAENSESEDADYTTLFDLLSIFYDKPINLNHKEIKSDLQQIRMLSDFQIDKLLAHIDKNGKLMSIYELQSIDGFDPQTIRNVMPFIIVTALLLICLSNFLPKLSLQFIIFIFESTLIKSLALTLL